MFCFAPSHWLSPRNVRVVTVYAYLLLLPVSQGRGFEPYDSDEFWWLQFPKKPRDLKRHFCEHEHRTCSASSYFQVSRTQYPPPTLLLTHSVSLRNFVSYGCFYKFLTMGFFSSSPYKSFSLALHLQSVHPFLTLSGDFKAFLSLFSD